MSYSIKKMYMYIVETKSQTLESKHLNISRISFCMVGCISRWRMLLNSGEGMKSFFVSSEPEGMESLSVKDKTMIDTTVNNNVNNKV